MKSIKFKYGEDDFIFRYNSYNLIKKPNDLKYLIRSMQPIPLYVYINCNSDYVFNKKIFIKFSDLIIFEENAFDNCRIVKLDDEFLFYETQPYKKNIIIYNEKSNNFLLYHHIDREFINKFYTENF